MTQDISSGESGLLTRRQWLQAHGFQIDPFDIDSWRGEADRLLDTAFVEFDNVDFERIKNPPKDGGYVFIFARAGGGKTSIRMRIKSELGPQAVPGGRQILIVEYVDHSYDKAESSLVSHVTRLDGLIRRSLLKYTGGDAQIKSYADRMDATSARITDHLGEALSRSRQILIEALSLCRTRGFDAVYIVIDIDSPVDGEPDDDSAFHRILPLARASDLFDIDGVVFKFLLPSEYKSTCGDVLGRGKYPLYEVKWNRERLRKVLEHRLIASQMQSPSESISDLRMDRSVAGIRLLPQQEPQYQYGTIEEALVEFGLEIGCPRAMWQLGHYVLEEHFNLSPNKRRHKAELIERSALVRAYERLRREIPIYATLAARLDRLAKCQQIISLISSGPRKLKRALKSLESIDDKKEIAVFLQFRLNGVINQYRDHSITSEEYRVELNRIADCILKEIKE